MKRIRTVSNWRSLGTFRESIQKLDRAERREVIATDIDPIKTKTYNALYNTSKDELVRIDKGKTLLIQHATVFGSFISLLEQRYPEAKASLRNYGERAEMDVVFDKRTIDGEEYQRGISIKSEFGRGITIQLYMIRSICENGMILGKDIKATIRLQKESEIDQYAQTSIEKVFGHADDNVITAIQRAKETRIPKTVTYQLVKSMVHSKKHRIAILSKIVEENPKGDEDTLFQIYNGFTSFITFSPDITANLERSLHSKAQSLLFSVNKYQNILERKHERNA